jgi:hypothetical protein
MVTGSKNVVPMERSCNKEHSREVSKHQYLPIKRYIAKVKVFNNRLNSKVKATNSKFCIHGKVLLQGIHM